VATGKGQRLPDGLDTGDNIPGNLAGPDRTSAGIIATFLPW